MKKNSKPTMTSSGNVFKNKRAMKNRYTIGLLTAIAAICLWAIPKEAGAFGNPSQSTIMSISKSDEGGYIDIRLGYYNDVYFTANEDLRLEWATIFYRKTSDASSVKNAVFSMKVPSWDVYSLQLKQEGLGSQCSYIDINGNLIELPTDYNTCGKTTNRSGNGWYYVTVRWYIPQSLMGESLKFRIGDFANSGNARYDGNGVYTSNDFSFEDGGTYTVNNRLANVTPTASYSFNSDGRIKVTMGGISTHVGGTVYLTTGSTSVASTNVNGSSYVFTVDFDSAKTTSTDYSVYQRYNSPNHRNDLYHNSNTASVKIPAYPQATNFTATFNEEDRLVELKWTMPAIASGTAGTDYLTAGFAIQRRKNSDPNGWQTIKTVNYDKDQTQYSFSDSTFLTLDVSERYHYRIRRTHQAAVNAWGWTHNVRTSNTLVNTLHVLLDNVSTRLSDDGGQAIVKWKVTGSLWVANVSTLKITRINKLSDVSSVVLETKDLDRVLNDSLIDDMIAMCNKYVYRVEIVTPSTYKASNMLTSDFIPSKKGSITSFSADKGYNPNKVYLEWTSDGYFDEFFIERKPYGSSDSEYRPAKTEPGSQVSDTYRAYDDEGDPGVVYLYRIKGLLKCADSTMESANFMTDVGFRCPTGMLTGSIAYGSGTAVSGVKVLAEPIDESDDANLYRSVYFDGTNTSYMQASNAAKMLNDTAFSIQMWVRPQRRQSDVIFQAGAVSLYYDGNNNLVFKAKDQYLTVQDTFTSGLNFTQLTLTYQANTMSMNLRSARGNYATIMHYSPAQTLGITANDNIVIGKAYQGYVDEIRIWGRSLDSMEIENTWFRYLAGNEQGLRAYWKFEEAILDRVYDMSYSGTANYNKNNADLYNVVFSDQIPSKDQLGNAGVADEYGYYTIKGIPYAGTGTSYRITPTYDVHTFKPGKQELFISANYAIHNKIDFEDISSFKVWGQIVYEGTTVPVSGVHFVVDGEKPCMKDGKLIETDDQGKYEIEVPIGWHFITANKQGHTFTVKRGVGTRFPNSRFPTDTVSYEGRYDFQTQEEVNFDDNTKVELIGRFVGGPIEGKKPVGFGVSKNNVGVAEIQLKLADKQGILAIDSSQYNKPVLNPSSSGKLQTTSYLRQGASDFISVTTNDSTGEFVVWLLPEDYLVNNINYEISAANNSRNMVVYDKVINMKILREPITLYDKDTSSVFIDEIDKKATDTIECNQKLDLVFRMLPAMEVLDGKKKDTIYGERQYVFTDPVSNEKDTIDLLDNGTYALGRPLFRHQGTYIFDISVFEEYENKDQTPSIIDRVPTIDGTVKTDDDIAINAEGLPKEVELDSLGKVTITFKIDAPNVTVNSQDAKNSYLKNFNFRVEFTDGTAPKQWKPTNMEAYVLGAKSDGNNFITRGPKELNYVLRDPPGSNSYAWIEEGSTQTTTNEFSFRAGATLGVTTKFAVGVDLTTFAGLGAGIILNNSVTNDYMVGLSTTQTGGYDNMVTKTTTTTKNIATSSASDYVGIDGDLFVGASYNIIFGEARFIDILESNNAPDNVPILLHGKKNDYYIASAVGLVLVPEFETDFNYTRAHIVNNLIPNIEKVRNSYLRYYEGDPPVNNSNSPVYISILPPNDPNYGKSNRDESAFGNNARTFKNTYDSDDHIIKDPSKVNSYYVLNPQTWAADSMQTDSVQFYNTEILSWENVLAQDEQQMLNANKLKNISFDAGVVYEETETTEESTAHSIVYEGSVDISSYQNIGATISGTGVFFTLNQDVNTSWSDNVTIEHGTSITYGWHLEDGDPSDYHTIDILKGDDVYSTGFKLLGGQTSCPYEGEVHAKYYQPERNHILQQATAKVQEPYFTINTNFIGNVPGNRAANFYLTVGNASLVAPAWYMLTVDEKSNPDGLILSIDGEPIANGRLLSFDPTESFAKTLSVKRTRMDVTEYDDIRLLLSSTCQEDIYDEVIISVHFLPSCSDLTLDRPVNNQILNIYSGDSAQYVVSEFDVNYNGFSHLILEYKPAAENAYIPFAYYYKDSAAYKADFGTPDEYKHLIGANDYEIRRWWKAPVMDGNYMVRSRSVCVAGPVTTYESVSDEVMVIKDMIPPVVFGTPQPADGILSMGDDLMLTFNEDIQPDYTYRISVQGELNGEELLHNGGLNFDGVNDLMEVKQPVNLEGKSFTVELWTLRDGTVRESTLFSHGTEDNQFEMGLDANDKLWMRINGIRLESAYPVTDINRSWTHLSAVYNADKHVIAAHVNGVNAIVETSVGAYNNTGVLTVGTDFERTNFYNGKMNELRLWTKARTASQIYELMNRRLSGMEMGLSSYWRMDEARGTMVEESIRGRHGTTNASWFVLPAGRALEFDGTNQYAHTQILPEIESEADFSVEFWFKADPSKTDACVFSTGRGDAGDYKPTGTSSVTKHFSIYFDNDNILKLRTSGHEETIAENLMDNNWHHFALSVNRHGNANVFVDFNLQRSFPSEYFGMFSGENVWLGAMGWVLSGLGNYTTGSYFKGNIDELRVWRAALTREGIKLAATSRLKGDESGLRAYYPFDTVETATLVHNTLCDQVKESITVEEKVTPNIPFQLFSGADFSTMAANIKPERRMRNVQFDRVYNERQIYLTLKEPMDVIENCILEVGVQDVQDMHGNRLVSPAKWTAYIDKNYLKWSEENLSFVKDLFAPLSFKANIINKSGLEQIFTIENMPSWLTVSPSTGVISPASSMEITFTVNEGLNIGMYDESIYLHNSDGFNELLAIDLRVVGDQPDWNVDPNAYDGSMNIFGELNIKGIVSTDLEDMLTAFDGNTCVGVTKLRYIPEYDRYLAFLNVYGNTDNTALKFKIWDASTGIVYTDVLPDTIKFRANSYQGTARDPIVFRTSNRIEQHIPLQAGWNWISTNVRKSDMSPQNVLSGNSFDANDQIKGQQAGIFSTYTSGVFPHFTNNTPVSNALMYMLKVKTSKDLVITGEPVNPDSVIIEVAPGWTWIGYTPQINLSLNEAFVGLNPHDGDLVKSQNSFSVYYDGAGGWLGTLNYLTPGNGYLYSSQDKIQKTFFYPQVSSLSSKRKSLNEDKYLSFQDEQLGISRGKYSGNLTLIARLDAEDICELDGMILGFVQEECRGYGNAFQIEHVDDDLYFITLSGEQGDEKLDFLYRAADGKTYKIKERLDFGSNQIYGSIKHPVVFTIGEPASDVSSLLSVYPTPFTSTLTLSFRIDDEAAGDVYFSIIDAVGKTCATFDQKQLPAGKYTLSLDNYVSSLASGIYFVRMTTVTDVQSIKISKTK